MNEKSRKKDQNGLEARESGKGSKKKGGQEPSLIRKPPWPAGLVLPPTKDVTCFIPEDLAVVLSREAFEQLFAYAYSTSSEVCCLGTVKQEGGRFRIERFYLVPQSGSFGHTELDDEAVAALVEDLIAEGKAAEAHSLKCWAHSHPGMDVFWSKTDQDTCKRLVTEYLISLVVSDDFAIRCRIDVGGAVPFTIDYVPVVVEMPVQTDSLQKYAEEVEEKVSHSPLLATIGKERAATPFSQEDWEEYVKQCRAEGLEPEREEFEMYGDLDAWF